MFKSHLILSYTSTLIWNAEKSKKTIFNKILTIIIIWGIIIISSPVNSVSVDVLSKMNLSTNVYERESVSSSSVWSTRFFHSLMKKLYFPYYDGTEENWFLSLKIKIVARGRIDREIRRVSTLKMFNNIIRDYSTILYLYR